MDYYMLNIIIAVFSLVVLSILIFENARISAGKKRLFIATNILISLAAIFECVGVHISGNENVPKVVLSLVKAADYTLTPMIGGALIVLVQKPNEKNRAIQWLFLGNAVVQVVSAFFGLMIVIDEHHSYSHGELYPVYMGFCSLILLIFAVKMIVYGKSFRRQNRISFYATIFLIIFGIAIQEILGGEFRVCYLAIAFGQTFLFIHYSEFSQIQMDDKNSDQQVKLLNDALTGVLSRFAYIDAINAYTASVPENLAVFMIDINGLKTVNDTLGHKAGDELICGAAKCIKRSLGNAGNTFRIGGDEFVVFAAMTREQASDALIDLKYKTEIWSGKIVKNLSLSVGCALAQDCEGLSIDGLVKEADKAMYEQKKEYYRASGYERGADTV